jgi:putative hydrolase of the HAD superfamily
VFDVATIRSASSNDHGPREGVFRREGLQLHEIFETVVDSGFVGCRKPESKIYAITLDRISLPAESCLFIDDVKVNCEGAEKAGMTAVHFQDNEQAIADVRGALGL